MLARICLLVIIVSLVTGCGTKDSTRTVQLEVDEPAEPLTEEQQAAAARLQQENEWLDAAYDEIDRLKAEAEEQEKVVAFSEALERVQEHYDGLAMTDDSYEAAKWFLDQLDGKSLDEFLAEHAAEPESEASSRGIDSDAVD